MSDGAVAERYARAVFELGVELGQLEKLAQEFTRAADTFAASAELRGVIDNPLVSESARDGLLGELAAKLGWSEVTKNTLRLMARRGRAAALPEVARRLAYLSDERAGILRAVVVSAVPLPDSVYGELKAKLETATKKKVVLERQQDPSLIGGIVTRIGDNTIDGSLEGRLAEMERQLLAT
ncbi:MAG: ATP synthase F1 subunit delta [Polyangiaceae bacterium]|nr:ATP synthase F1 subunit delta [Polyangiaceae bacterium]